MNSNDKPDNALKEDVRDIVTKAKVFVVGAGGIGCELIKNLVLVGFKNLEIIDLDTIDVSNLNRQFLFQKKHVGKSKARVAHENAVSLRPDINVVSHHDSIFNPKFNMEYFKKFDIVLNALDNRAARNHVNRLCLAARVPLVESGSAGYLGQVNVIKRSETECYECSPKPRQKTFPGCTIRNTPSELIHCVVWAKYLFNQLFGEEDADQDVSPDTADPEAALTDSADNERVSTRLWAKENDYKPEKIFNKLFKTDIEYLLSMDKLWTKRKPPKPLPWVENDISDREFLTSSQTVLSLEENMQLFGQSITKLKDKFKEEGDNGLLVWDKDDNHAMNFVASAANIRAEVFDIARKSVFEIKSMAGNIIPAIATTNAVVAGLIVMQAMCILQNEFSRCRNVFVSRLPNPTKKLIAPCSLDPPRKSCYVCAEKPEVTLKLDTKTFTLGDLKEKVLNSHLGMLAPDVEIDGTSTILLSSEEGESDSNLPKSLSDFNVQHGSRLRVDDFLQNFNLILNILHDVELPEDEEFKVINQGALPAPSEENTNDLPESSKEEVQDDEDDLVIVESNGSMEEEMTVVEETNDEGNRKRKLLSAGDADSVEQTVKKAKMCPVVINEPDDDIQIVE